MLRYQHQAFGDRRRHRRGAGHRDLLRVAQERIGQPADLRPHRGGEEQRLPLARQQADDALDIGDEAHVQHAVGFVDHQDLGVGQQDRAALEHVDQAAGGGDQHIDAAHQHVLLIGHALAADDQRVGQLQVFAVVDKILSHLQREFAGRLQDQAARHAGAGARAGQDVQHRQREAGGLAGAGLRGAHHVAPHQHEGNGLLLDRGGVAIAHVLHRAQHGFRQAEIGKGRARSLNDEGGDEAGRDEAGRGEAVGGDANGGDNSGRGVRRRVVRRVRRGGRCFCQTGSSRWQVAACAATVAPTAPGA